MKCPSCGRGVLRGFRFCTNCGVFLEDATSGPLALHEAITEVLGERFRYDGELGRGGFGIVYRFRDNEVPESLAVKVVRPELSASEAVVGRFKREIAVVREMDHPNVIPIRFGGDDRGLLYYAMPLVAGPTLREMLEGGTPLPLSTAISVLRGVAQGLAHAHDHGIVHRDLKPSNVLVAGKETPIIVDFGIAKVLWGDGGSLSYSGEVLGTVEYMSPEQASNARTVTPRSDMYGWGCLAYQCLVGSPPFTGRNPREVMHKQIWVEAPRVRDYSRDVPGPLAEAVKVCLEKDPVKRPTSMRHVIASMEHL